MKRVKQTTALLLLIAMAAGVLAGCSNSTAAGTDDEASGDTVIEVIGDGVDLSDSSYDFQAEYFYSDYNAASNEDVERQDGIDTFEDKDIVFKSLYYDELLYLLEQEGDYLILLSGSWCHNSRATIGYVNEYAKAYDIDTVYTFDFRLDGETRDTHIRETALTAEYGGEDYTAADWNYLYGELVARYFTNLNDWVEYKEDDEENALTWYDAEYNESTIAKVQVPFLFLYNKDNTTRYVPVYDEDDKQIGVEEDESASGTYPIVYGFEEMVDKDATGVYDSDEDGERNYITDEYTARLENIFTFIDENKIEIGTYTDADYIVDAYVVNNGRGHSEKMFDIFEEGEQINIEVITYRQMNWLLEQEGSAVILFGGAWCANTQAAIRPINDYAVENDITVYMMDFRLDGKYPIDFWDYDRDRQFEIRSSVQAGKAEELPDSTFVDEDNPFAYLYTNLINQYLTNVETITETDADNYYIYSTDPEGEEAQAPRLQAPYLIAYNKDGVDADGFAAPILAWHEEMLEVTEDSIEDEIYIYQTENYESYTAGIEKVLNAYSDSVGRTFTAYSGDPAQELED